MYPWPLQRWRTNVAWFSPLKGLDGNVVYPVTLAGGLFIVVLAGVVLFKEKVGKAGLLGIVLGILSLALLSIS